ncbi:Bacterial Ig-like domain (group 2) [Lentilactobacillus parabuchneri]|uniref:Ig-like domain-containing protein n=1 Tax=Lentilactobacillus parabuchneri TaxID=152331 RepID=UPI000A107376|nr:Ig-like domain-containing protein [Lentilactobacillus parabuchneri]MDB1104752.1 Ig-like domain-containing protein [Lentilactobacillus parabuchneri]ORN05398.1 Bacterial Ig-like domain (group 2) [Lentilactobacillus parabuchneri]ORN39601.1 Bacterial Ig-like domain (group 2) [Lentilactobacillus parabuchneri]
MAPTLPLRRQLERVAGNNEVPASGVSLDKTTASVEVGETIKLNATVVPANATNRTVAFTSADDTVASVAQDGTVTGIKAGTVVITAAINGKTATATITVE